MRELAKGLGVTVGTINRAYQAAEKRGLVISTVGRGTFIRPSGGNKQSVPPVLPEHIPENLCNLTLNAPVHVELNHYLSKTLSTLSAQGGMDSHLQYGDTRGKKAHRTIVNKWLESREVDSNSGETILTHGGQQGLACILSALTKPGDSVLVEELTYSGAKNLAKLYGLILCPVAMDEAGLVLTPQSYFSTNSEKSSTAVRLCVGLVNSEQLLEEALRTIAATAKCPPGTPYFGF